MPCSLYRTLSTSVKNHLVPTIIILLIYVIRLVIKLLLAGIVLIV